MEMDECNLWCYFEGSKDYFPVSIPITQYIDSLKEKIHMEQNEIFTGYAYPTLILFKVC